ncbi:MAG TPA: sulfate permease [Verrucomicrobiae bacterium]
MIGIVSTLSRVFPGLFLLRGYRRQWIAGDIIAGISGCAVMIPSVIAYARLMGMPPQIGLFAALVPLVVYPLFCSSPQVIVGPDIAICLLIVNAVGPLAGNNGVLAAELASVLAVLSGLLLLLASRAGLGKVADFLSKPVLVGYMTGAALILMSSQLGAFLGVPLTHNYFFPRLIEACAKINQARLPTIILGLVLLAMLLALRRFAPKAPSALIACVVAIAASRWLNLAERGVAVVGQFPGGLPRLTIPSFDWHNLEALLPAAIGISFLAYTEGVLLARAFAARNGYEVAPNQELAALGVANLVNGVFQGFAVTGSQSRTAVNDAAGGKTQLASFVMAGSTALFLLYLTPLLASLPLVALGAILINGGWRLVEFDAMKRIYRYYPASAAVAAVTTLGVLAAGVVTGILLGVALSLLGLIKRISHPPDAVLHEIPGHGFHDIGEKPGATVPGLLAYRFYAPLLFSNCGYFAERVHKLIADSPRPVRWFLVDAQAITDIDVTAVETLHALRAELNNKGIKMKFAHANPPLRALLERTGLAKEIGEENFFASVHECIKAFTKANL